MISKFRYSAEKYKMILSKNLIARVTCNNFGLNFYKRSNKKLN